MKYVLGIFCLIFGICFYLKVDLMIDNTNRIFGLIFILLGDLFFNYKREDR